MIRTPYSEGQTPKKVTRGALCGIVLYVILTKEGSVESKPHPRATYGTQ